MKVLILGAPTNALYRCFGQSAKISGGGWVENLVNTICDAPEIELYVAAYAAFANQFQMQKYENVNYCALPIRSRNLSPCTDEMVKDLKKMMRLVEPDVVHIIGTEREFDLELLKIAGAEKTVVSITGLVTYIADHYYGGVDYNCFKRRSLGDIIRGGGPIKEKEQFEIWGKSERELLAHTKYVMGRTTWDYACIKLINPEIEYHYCGEILNPVFSQDQWDAQKMRPHRIFVSQGSYALKGLHMLLGAFPKILERYPDAEIVVAGADILASDTWMQKIKRTTYAQYLQKQLRVLKIPAGKVTYTGPLDAQGMLKQYLQCNVFVMPSSIENSPNSLGEAMRLGVPCVASCVGGIPDMLRDKVDGYLYPFDEPYMLAYYIMELFEHPEIAAEFSKNGREAAAKRFQQQKVKETTLSLYHKIYACSKKADACKNEEV